MTQSDPLPDVQRVRVIYTRRESLRYISHLDMKLVLERTLRRAGVPLAYSKGFNPKPRLHMAAALPLGFLSREEVADFWLEIQPGLTPVKLLALIDQIRAAAPPGLEVRQIDFVPLELPALQTQVQSADYTATPLRELDVTALNQSIRALLEAADLPRERRGKPYNLRPLIENLDLYLDEQHRSIILMRLSAREGATGRPEEVLNAMNLDPTSFRIERTALIFS